MSKRKKEPVDWDRVFQLRCRSKRGERLTLEESQYCLRALDADKKRYCDMDARVFNATAPFGSSARWQETGEP